MRAILIVLLLSFIISCERVEMISEHKTIDEYITTYTNSPGNSVNASGTVTFTYEQQ